MSSDINISYLIALLIPLILVILWLYILHKEKLSHKISYQHGNTIKKLRKRDAVAFIGKKVFHNFANFKNRIKNFKTRRRPHLRFKLKKNLIGGSCDWAETNLYDFPKEYENIGKALIKIFHFNRPLIGEIFETVVTTTLEKEKELFDTGQDIHPLYVIQSGCIDLYYTDESQANILMRTFLPGETIFSVIYFLQKILNQGSVEKLLLKAVAREPSIVYSVPASTFMKIFASDWSLLIRLVQVTMIRIQNMIHRTLCEHFSISVGSLFDDNKNMDPLHYKNVLVPTIDKSKLRDSVMKSLVTFSLFPKPTRNKFVIPEENDSANNTATYAEDISKLFDSEAIGKLFTRESVVRLLKAGEYLDAGDSEIMLHYIHRGVITAVVKSSASSRTQNSIKCYSQRFCSMISTMSGMHSTFDLIAQEESIVVSLPSMSFQRITVECPDFIPKLAAIVLDTITPFLKNISFGLDWENFEICQNVYSQGSISNKIYLILFGRIRLVTENTRGEKTVIGEFSKNDFVGIEETFEHTPRIATSTAVRATEVVVISHDFLEFIQRSCKDVMSKIAANLSQRIGLLHSRQHTNIPEISGYSTIAIVPASNTVPIRNFVYELKAALNLIKPAAIVDSSCIASTAKSNPIISRFRYIQLITQLETDNYMVLWLCDNFLSYWTKQCVLHADLILIVASIYEDYIPNNIEKQIKEMNETRTPYHLVLMHKEHLYKPPENTAQWLNCRPWISNFHHIRCHPHIFRNESIYDDYTNLPHNRAPPHKFSDISRLARRLTNTAVGLVLGGGGARGFAHIGAILALEKAGIPVDMIGGTSIGSFMGALYACYQDSTYLIRRANHFAEVSCSYFGAMTDLTLPIISFFTGARFNSMVFSQFEEMNIEDLLIPFFCTSTDISCHQLKVHTSGPIWRYVRASMTLLNIFPPICDPKNNHLLVDGGYLNILPADVMAKMGVKYVVAVNVSAESNDCLGDYGDQLSGWTILWNRINPFSKKIMIPSMNEIQDHLCFINCINMLKDVERDPNFLYLSPPVQQFTTLGFQHYMKITDIGYTYTDNILKEWKSTNKDNLISLFKKNAVVESSTYFPKTIQSLGDIGMGRRDHPSVPSYAFQSDDEGSFDPLTGQYSDSECYSD